MVIASKPPQPRHRDSYHMSTSAPLQLFPSTPNCSISRLIEEVRKLAAFEPKNLAPPEIFKSDFLAEVTQYMPEKDERAIRYYGCIFKQIKRLAKQIRCRQLRDIENCGRGIFLLINQKRVTQIGGQVMPHTKKSLGGSAYALESRKVLSASFGADK